MKGHICEAASQIAERFNAGIRELSKDLGVSDRKISEYLHLLWEPEYVLDSIKKDSNEKKLFYLKSLFGGGIHQEKNKNSARWYLKSRKMFPLIEALQDFAPAWQTFIKEYYNWSEAKDVETKIEIAKRIKKI